MRAVFALIVLLLGVNILIEVLDSEMVNTIKERNANIEKMLQE